MRLLCFSMLAVLATSLALRANQNVAPPGPAPAPENLGTVLRGWEKAMTELKSFACVVKRQSLDKALDAKDDYKGFAMYLKASKKEVGDQALLELTKVNNPKIFEKYICTGTDWYEYAPANNVVRVHKLPKIKQGGLQQGNILAFVFDMGAAQAKARYHLELEQFVPPNPHYYSILLKPKADKDKSDFTFARLVLYRSNNLPAEIWYRQSNGKEITWNFTELQVNVQIPPRFFEPQVPEGWRVVPVNTIPMIPKK